MSDPSPSESLPLDDISYLARSPHRVTVLGRLAKGSTTRRDLRESTDISQPTLGRILDGFEKRGWASCDRTNDRAYALTPVGELVADSFDDFLATMATVQQLRTVSDGLPLEDMDFDIERLATADITVPSATDAMAHMRREDELIEDAERVRFLCSSAYGPSIKAYRDWIVEGDLSFEAIVTVDALEAAAADPEVKPWVRELAAADNARLYRYDGPVTMMMGVIDDVASLAPLDESGIPRAFIESTDIAVRSWVEGQLELYREDAVPLTPERIESVAFTA